MTEPRHLKEQLLTHCRTVTEERITGLRATLAAITAARDGETKSSAGDKFETGRAMMQLEAAKLSRQLAEANLAYGTLDRIDVAADTGHVAAGSLVATDRGNYFLAIGLGKVVIEGRKFFCTSLSSPVGQAMLGKRVGETFAFNDLMFTVKGIA